MRARARYYVAMAILWAVAIVPLVWGAYVRIFHR